MNWIEVNGVSLRYELAGRGSETVVLVHEAGGSLESWDDVLPALQARYRTLRYDQRGFGLSEKIHAELSLDDMLADLCALLDALAIPPPCHIVGGALGAGIALAFAARHPARVAKLVACNPATGISAHRRKDVDGRAAILAREGMRGAVDAILAKSYPDVLRTDAARFRDYRGRWLANDPACFAALNRMVARMDLSADFAKIACPTLVIASVHDKLRTPAEIRQTVADIPHLRCVDVESGHFMAVQSPALLLEHLLPFLAGTG
jgi:3-oxoadipate enol-lactonase